MMLTFSGFSISECDSTKAGTHIMNIKMMMTVVKIAMCWRDDENTHMTMATNATTTARNLTILMVVMMLMMVMMRLRLMLSMMMTACQVITLDGAAGSRKISSR